MALIISPFSAGRERVISADAAGDLIVNPFYVDLKVGDLLAGNIIDLGVLPAGHTINGAILIPDDLDTGTTITIDVGIMSGDVGQNDASRTVGQELFVASTAAQTGSPASASTTRTVHLIPASQLARSIGAKIVAAPTGATAGRLRLSVTMYASRSGFQY